MAAVPNQHASTAHEAPSSAEQRVTRLGFGAAPIGNLYAEVDEAEAIAAVRAAHAAGIRYFDTAPYYGYGLSEQRLGDALKALAQADVRISTKVGRRVAVDAGSDARASSDGFAVRGGRAEFDYSRDGVMRSVHSSLERLGVSRVDTLLLHDIGRLTHADNHPAMLKQALHGALPAMAELKSSGVCRAIGIGVNEQDIALELMSLFQLDCVMLAGRYTLLEQIDALPFMAQAHQQGVAVIVAGPYSSGLMSDARGPGSTYNYAPVDAPTLQRAQQIYAVCAAHGVDVGAAALQFPLAHPAVSAVVAGMRNADEVACAASRIAAPLPRGLWDDLKAQGLIRAELPTP